jgi:hypothetical protein
MQAARGEVRPPSAQNPAVPPAVDALCMAMLARERDGRYRDAASAARAISALPEYPRAGQYQLAEYLVRLFPSDAPALEETLRSVSGMQAPGAPNLGPTVMASSDDVTRTRRPSVPPVEPWASNERATDGSARAPRRRRRRRESSVVLWLLPLAALCAAGAALIIYHARSQHAAPVPAATPDAGIRLAPGAPPVTLDGGPS